MSLLEVKYTPAVPLGVCGLRISAVGYRAGIPSVKSKSTASITIFSYRFNQYFFVSRRTLRRLNIARVSPGFSPGILVPLYRVFY